MDYVLIAVWHTAKFVNSLHTKVLAADDKISKLRQSVRCSPTATRPPPPGGCGVTVVEETGQEIHGNRDNAGGGEIRYQRAREDKETNYQSHRADAPSGGHVQQQDGCIAGATAEPNTHEDRPGVGRKFVRTIKVDEARSRRSQLSVQPTTDVPRGPIGSKEEEQRIAATAPPTMRTRSDLSQETTILSASLKEMDRRAGSF